MKVIPNTLSVLYCTPAPGAESRLRQVSADNRPALQVACSDLSTEIDPALASADIIVLQQASLNARQLRAATQCRAVIHAGPGAHTDLEVARELGIFVSSVPGAMTEIYSSVADRVMREFVGGSPGHDPARPLQATRRRPRAGFIGFGRLGQAFARVARGVKMDVWAYDPYALEETFSSPEIHQAHQLHDILGIADLVFVQVAAAESNRAMIGSPEIQLTRAGAWLVNLGWESAVDAVALQDAVRTGRLGRVMLSRPLDPQVEQGSDSIREAPPEERRIEWINPMEGREEEAWSRGLSLALDLAESMVRGEDPSPLLIDPPLPRWGS